MASFRGITLPAGWQAFKDSLIYRQYGVSDIRHRKESLDKGQQKVRIAGFDFDDTLVRKHDHSMSFPGVTAKLRELNDDGYLIAIFTNEALDHFKSTSAIQNAVSKKLLRLHRFAEALGFPVQVFVATRYDGFRKPSEADVKKKKPAGGKLMWQKMLELSDLGDEDVDVEGSLYVGDAAGRPTDFSDADLAFARCVGVKFSLPEHFFIARKSEAIDPTGTETAATDGNDHRDEASKAKRVKVHDED